MGLELKSECEKCGATLAPGGAAYICSYECTYCASCAGQMNFGCPNCEVNLCGDRVAKRHLIPAPALMLDSISKKTLIADSAHVAQRTMHAGGQKILAHAGQRRGLCSAEHVRRNG